MDSGHAVVMPENEVTNPLHEWMPAIIATVYYELRLNASVVVEDVFTN